LQKYKEYWEWVENRNEDRYQNNQMHGKNYDSKNMMHVFRLLEMAIEIGSTHKVSVKRPNRDFLLEIKAGKFDYETLLQMADELYQLMQVSFHKSDLPETPDLSMINKITFLIREKFYELTK
jgi:uncharacterized protein